MTANIDKTKQQQLDKIIKNHVLSSIGAGLIPVPGMDIVALLTIQTNLIKELTDIYKVSFVKESVKNIITSLVGHSLLTNAAPVLASMVKIIPGVGQLVGMTAMPITCGASTYATGKVFVYHFESGGTLLTFNHEKMKAYYKKMMKEGKDVAGNLKQEAATKTCKGNNNE